MKQSFKQCPNCCRLVEVYGKPGEIVASEWWICIACPATVCIYCYVSHGQRKHTLQLKLSS